MPDTPAQQPATGTDLRFLLGPGVAVVKHIAHYLVAGGYQAERPRGRHAEVVHGLAAQKLAHR